MSCLLQHFNCKVVALSCMYFCHHIQWPYIMSCTITTSVTCSMQLTLYFYNELQLVIETRKFNDKPKCKAPIFLIVIEVFIYALLSSSCFHFIKTFSPGMLPNLMEKTKQKYVLPMLNILSLYNNNFWFVDV